MDPTHDAAHCTRTIFKIPPNLVPYFKKTKNLLKLFEPKTICRRLCQSEIAANKQKLSDCVAFPVKNTEASRETSSPFEASEVSEVAPIPIPSSSAQPEFSFPSFELGRQLIEPGIEPLTLYKEGYPAFLQQLPASRKRFPELFQSSCSTPTKQQAEKITAFETNTPGRRTSNGLGKWRSVVTKECRVNLYRINSKKYADVNPRLSNMNSSSKPLEFDDQVKRPMATEPDSTGSEAGSDTDTEVVEEESTASPIAEQQKPFLDVPQIKIFVNGVWINANLREFDI